MPTILYPDVPDAPGVPPVLRNPLLLLPAQPALLLRDTVIGYGSGLSPQWGIYKGAAPVVIADTVISFGYKQEWAIADYPVERGGFESYDKVDIPFDARVQFASGGSEDNKKTLLDSIQAIAGTLELFDIITPEEIYTSVNVAHFDYRRTSRNGVGLLTVDIWLLEVRISGVTNYKNTKAPASASPSQTGAIQTVTPTTPQLAIVGDVN